MFERVLSGLDQLYVRVVGYNSMVTTIIPLLVRITQVPQVLNDGKMFGDIPAWSKFVAKDVLCPDV